jgi:carbonic anhydrase
MENNKLMSGNALFQKSYYKAHEKDFLELVKKGQHPKALYIGCSDSRVIPNLITKSSPGDLFVIRNVGNFVAPYSPNEDFHATASAIEYAVSILKVKNIIVCGHTHCGAISAIYDKSELEDDELIHTRKWLTLGEAPKKQAMLALGVNADKVTLLRLTEKLSVITQIENLLTYPSVKKRVDDERISIHGWVYDIESGSIEYFDPETSQFLALSELESKN